MTTKRDPLDLAAIEARCAAATAMRDGAPSCEDGVIAALDFATECCTDIPALCAEVRRLMAELDNPVRTGVCETCVEVAIKKNEELLADNERMRRGIEEVASRYAEHEECRNSGCSDPDADVVTEFGNIAVNLLAGREWSDGGE